MAVAVALAHLALGQFDDVAKAARRAVDQTHVLLKVCVCLRPVWHCSGKPRMPKKP